MVCNSAVRRPERATEVPTTPASGPPGTVPYSEPRLRFAQCFLPRLRSVMSRFVSSTSWRRGPQNKQLTMPFFYICWLGLGDYLYRFPRFDYCEAVNEALRHGSLDVWIENENGERIA